MEYKEFIFFDMKWDTNGEEVKELPKAMLAKVELVHERIEANIVDAMELISNYWGYQLKRARPVLNEFLTPDDLKCDIVDINGNEVSHQSLLDSRKEKELG